MFTAMKRNRHLHLTSLAQFISPLEQRQTGQICLSAAKNIGTVFTAPTHETLLLFTGYLQEKVKLKTKDKNSPLPP